MSVKSYLKKILPKRTIELIRGPVAGAHTWVRDAVLGAVSRNGALTNLYFALGGQLSREAKAVAAGQLRYRKDHAQLSTSYFLLRRNVHRLEKGLIMRPRRAVFAADYILPTVSIFQRACSVSGHGWGDELVWADDVLAEYFRVVDVSSPNISVAWERYRGIDRGLRPANRRVQSVPYKRALSTPVPVDYQAFVELSHRRRSVRWYLPERVDRALIDQAVLAAGQAPSACNRQPFQFHMFDNPPDAARIAAIPMGTSGFAQQVPGVAVVVGRLRAYPSERDRHAIYIDGSLAAMAFMFAMETMGLATCPINWPDHEPYETQMRRALNLDDDERVVMLIAFGWPDPEGLVPYSAKRPLDQLRVYG